MSLSSDDIKNPSKRGLNTEDNDENDNYIKSKIKRRKLLNESSNDNNISSSDESSNLLDDDLIEKNIIPPEVLYRLKDFSLFKDAPNNFFIDLAKVLRLVQYRPQEYIVKFGEPAKSMYWILRGTVGVTSTDGEAIYAELAAGSFFGEIGILFNCPRTATVVARTKVLLGVLTKDSLTNVLANYPKIEQIIRDEAQERLLMQEKKKSLLKMSLPTISRKVSIVPPPLPFQKNSNTLDNSNYSQNIVNQSSLFNISQVANEHDQIPGPCLPPVTNTIVNFSALQLPTQNHPPHHHHHHPEFTHPFQNTNNNTNNSQNNQNNHLPNFNASFSFSPFSSFSSTGMVPILENGNSNNNNDPHNTQSHNYQNLKRIIRNSNLKIEELSSLNARRSTFTSMDNIDNSISIREFLCSLKLFATLPNNIIHELALDVEVLRYRPMENIIRKGDFGRDIYFIVYGEVEVLNTEGVLARLTPMMYFGEFAFLSTLNGAVLKPRSADIRTITDCEILMIKASSLDSICERYPTVFDEFKKTASERLDYNSHNNNINININNTNNNNNNNGNLNNFGLFKSFNFSKESRENSYSTNHSSDFDPVFSQDEASITNPTESSESHSVTPSLPKYRRSSQMIPPQAHTNHNNTNGNNSMFKQFSFTTPNDTSTIAQRERNESNMLTMPPLNPVHGSIQTFSTFQRGNFQYAPLEFRRRLSTVNGGRRRSSVLNVGPLPDSIFLKIFQLLDLKSLMKSVRVCLRWKQLIYLSTSLFKVLDLKPYGKEMNDDLLVKITKLVGSRPEIIDITNCYHITDEGFSFLINEISIRGNIKEIIMENNWNISAMALMDLSISCRNLMKLGLSNCRKVKDDVMLKLIGTKGDYSSGCHNLQDLRLGYCKYLTDKTMDHIINNSSDVLVNLDLTRCTTITDNGFMNFNNNIFTRLKRLILKDCTFLSDIVVERITLSCPNLEVLDLTFCCMLTDYSLKLLGFRCKKLIDLNLSFCGAAVSDYSLTELKPLINLNYLSIKGCVRVTREGVDMLLTELKNLKELNLLQCTRVNVFRGVNVKPFDKLNGSKYSCLKIKPHGRIVKVYV